jgi:hypothetical protein
LVETFFSTFSATIHGVGELNEVKIPRPGKALLLLMQQAMYYDCE